MSVPGKRVLRGPRAVVLLTLASLLVPSLSVGTAVAQYRIYPSSGDIEVIGDSITLLVPPEGVIPLILTRSADDPAVVDLSLSTFTDELGNLVEIRLGLPGDTARESSAHLDNVGIDRAAFPITLEVPVLPSPGWYAGYLFLSQEGVVLTSYKVALSRGKVASPATLVVDRQALTVSHTRPFLGGAGPQFTLHLRESSREWPLDGLFVRLLEVQASNNRFDPKLDLSFEVNGTPVEELWTLPPKDDAEADLRRIEPGEQAAVRGVFSDLPAGEYTTKLRFLAANSQEGERQDVALTINVRDSFWWAVIALTLAIMFSFFSNKWLRTRRQRLQYRRRLARLRPAWLGREPSVMSVVWVRAIFRQAGDLSKRWLLSGTNVVNDRVNQATQMLAPLERIRAIRQRIQAWGEHAMVIRRAEKTLRGIVASLGADPLDDKHSAEIDAELTALEAWFDPQELSVRYGNSLEVDVQHLLGYVRPEEAAEEEADREVIRGLVDELKKPAQSDLDKQVAREDVYSKLKILWERRGEEEFRELVQLCREGKSAEALFEVADRSAWQRLKSAREDRGVRFVSPVQETLESLQAYEPLRFEVAPGDPGLGDNFLFKHGLEYRWRICLETSARRWRRESSSTSEGSEASGGKRCAVELEPVTKEPRVVQYVPKPGRLTASVQISFGGDHLTVEAPPRRIVKSSDFRWQRAFETVELGAVFVAWVLALVSGLLMFWVDSTSFGSVKDYLMLALWGAGADQGKNFIQNLESFSEASLPAGGEESPEQ